MGREIIKFLGHGNFFGKMIEIRVVLGEFIEVNFLQLFYISL